MQLSAKCSNCKCDLEVDSEGYIYCPECGIKSSEPLSGAAKKSGSKSKKTTSTSSKKSTSGSKKKTENSAEPSFTPTGDAKLDKKLEIAFGFYNQSKIIELKAISASILAEWPNNGYAAYLLAFAQYEMIKEDFSNLSYVIDSELEAIRKNFDKALELLDPSDKIEKEANKYYKLFVRDYQKYSFEYVEKKINRYQNDIKSRKAQNVYINNPISVSSTVYKYKTPLEDGTTEKVIFSMSSNNAMLDDVIQKDSQPTIDDEPQQFVYKDRSILLGDTNPFAFPAKSESKFVKICFWVLTFFVAIYGMALYAIFFNPSIVSADVWASTTYTELINIVGGGLLLIAGWLFWIIYYLVRRFARENLVQPPAIKYIRLVSIILLILSFIFLIWRGLALGAALALPEQMPNLDIASTKTQLLVAAIVFAVCILSLIILGVIDRTIFKINMQAIEVFNLRILLLLISFLLEGLSIVVVVFSGIITLVNSVNAGLLSMVFDSLAPVVAQYAQTALIVSASVFVASLVLDIVISNVQPKKREPEMEEFETTEKSSEPVDTIVEDCGEYVIIRRESEQVALINREKALEALQGFYDELKEDMDNFNKASDQIAHIKHEKLGVSNIDRDLYFFLKQQAGI